MVQIQSLVYYCCECEPAPHLNSSLLLYILVFSMDSRMEKKTSGVCPAVSLAHFFSLSQSVFLILFRAISGAFYPCPVILRNLTGAVWTVTHCPLLGKCDENQFNVVPWNARYISDSSSLLLKHVFFSYFLFSEFLCTSPALRMDQVCASFEKFLSYYFDDLVVLWNVIGLFWIPWWIGMFQV